GTNKLLEYAQDVVETEIASIMAGTYKQGKVPPLWDGDSTLRIMEILNRIV
ncbi:MAG: UDP-N-acetylglucosamine 2-epimerase (non-hydrolyzing), partial [Bacteroidia bacterium]|nr:UDP-N-acetylglucosamine 2-epimerase (non-hydrolyzing) [Bacteroidia bacterium]